MPQKMISHKSISQLREGMGLGKPTHPLINIIDTSKLAYGEEMIGQKFSNDLYCIAIKDASCGMDYGRNHYDFNNGVSKVDSLLKDYYKSGKLLESEPPTIRYLA
jgi:hypothetical protein